MTKEYLELRSLLIRLPDFQREFQNYTGHECKILELVNKEHEAASRAYLESSLPSTASKLNMASDNRHIFLTPFEDNNHTYLPLLSVDLDFTLAWPMISIHLLHYGLDKGHSKAEKLKCFGYRYDKPAARVGDHDYFHVQFTHGTEKGRHNNRINRWISTKDPSIPIDATDSVQLFLSAVIAVRNGFKTRRDLFDEWRQAGIAINSMLMPMAFQRWRPASANNT